MKKLIAITLAFVMLLGLAACGQESEPVATEPTVSPTMAPYVPAAKSVCVLVPEATEGWEAAAAEAAKTKAEELNAAGEISVTVQTYADEAAQVKLLEDIAAQSAGDGSQGVVLMPAGEAAAEALQKLLDANVAYALAENIPAAAAAASVANVSYDHRQIGAAAAAYLTAAGLQQKNDVVILESLSPADALKTEGFKLYLQGKLGVDGAYIETPWDSFATISYSEMESTTREGAKTYFEGYMEDGDRAYTGYFAAWDDDYVLAILDALEDAHISKNNRNNLFAMKPTVTGFGADAELCQLLNEDAAEDDKKEEKEEPKYSYMDKFGDINTIVYDAGMLAQALQAMYDHMSGEVVEQTQLLTVQWAFTPAEEAEETE